MYIVTGGTREQDMYSSKWVANQIYVYPMIVSTVVARHQTATFLGYIPTQVRAYQTNGTSNNKEQER